MLAAGVLDTQLLESNKDEEVVVCAKGRENVVMQVNGITVS